MNNVKSWLVKIIPNSILRYSFRLLFRQSLFPFYRALHKVSLRGMGINHTESFRLSGELNLIRKLSENFKNPIIFDLGAHHGEYTQIIRRHCPDAQIYAFEPHPKSFQKLKSKIEDKQTRVFQYAVGKEADNTRLYDSASKDGSKKAALDHSVFSDVHESEIDSFEVNVITLDEFVNNENIPKIDLLKVDVEGKEYEVLEGCQKTIERGLIHYIQFEFSSMHTISATFLKDFQELLSDYQLFRLLPDGMVPLDELTVEQREIFEYQNILGRHDSINHTAETLNHN